MDLWDVSDECGGEDDARWGHRGIVGAEEGGMDVFGGMAWE